MLTIGHRGASGYEPENTLRSFQRAITLGCQMVELDVHVCATGEIVVIHDATVDRTTTGHGRITDLPLAKLQTLDAGKGEKIPTLIEVLHLCHDTMQVNIELKGKGTADAVAALVARECASGAIREERLLISSFHQNLIQRYRDLRPEGRIGILTSWPWGWERRARAVHACAIHLYYKRVTRQLVTRAHKNNWNVYPWTVNEPKNIARLQAIGVDGIITNFPDRVTHAPPPTP